ncbi:MAG: hypothetical protein ACU0AT_07065 [Tranquillimonas sp.]
MSRRAIAAVLVLGLAAGCARVAESRFNPFNWFGGSTEVATLTPPEGYAAAPVDRRPLMDQIAALSVDRTPGGAIVRATGLPPSQGWWDGELVAAGEPEAGILTLQFRAVPPARPSRVSTPRSREVVVGLFLSDRELEGLREIRVNAARNARSARR